MQTKLSVALFAGLSIAFSSLCLTGCSRSELRPLAAPVVTQLQAPVIATDRPSVAPGLPTSNEVRVTAVVDKAAILGQEFVYGADLQYSSLYDEDMDLYNQSLALGHIPARFRIVTTGAETELQLLADNTRLFPSEVNHPELLLSRFRVIAQTETTLTIGGANSGVFLAQVFKGTDSETSGSMFDASGEPPRDLWVRSFEFIPQGNYLMQQTSVVLADGKIGEFLESIFPRSVLAPGAAFEKFKLDPENPAGGEGGIFDRVRLLGGEKIFTSRGGPNSVEEKSQFAQHFDISGGRTIDWYVTRNIPDEDLEPVRQGVEGWNRYFRNFAGIARDVVLFKGRLPEGIRLGDPRFNVINWDNRLVAGAAYETQASDPETGLQSHSLIYLPAAWLKIGTDYWKQGVYSDRNGTDGSVSPSRLRGAAASSRLACLRDLREAAALSSSGRLTESEIQEFGVRLLKGTLFHEVGHALGLAHNFKGSLSFDRSKPGSMFSTSIMDYNDFEIERAAFPKFDSAEGPELAYDRQALSVLYNRGADLSSDAPLLPLCNDEEADNEDGGVDPLCVRYDVERDPTTSITTAWNRVTQATLPSDVTLAQALGRVPPRVLSEEVLARTLKREDLLKRATETAQALSGSVQFYLVTSKASLSRAVRTHIKSLLLFADDVLTEEYDEVAIRKRAWDGVQTALGLKTLPEVPAHALTQAIAGAVARLKTSPYAQGLSRDENDKLDATLTEAITQGCAQVLTSESKGLPKLRSATYAALTRRKKVPFYFGKLSDAAVDYESALAAQLGEAVAGAPDKITASERQAAANALLTYAGRRAGDTALSSARAALQAQRLTAETNAQRELVETLIGILK